MLIFLYKAFTYKGTIADYPGPGYFNAREHRTLNRTYIWFQTFDKLSTASTTYNSDPGFDQISERDSEFSMSF